MDAGCTPKRVGDGIFRINARISELPSGRPLRFPLEIQVQKRRKPFRCHDTTVSGSTMINARRQFLQVLERHSQNNDLPFAVVVGDSAA
jgi:hypothetical protein